MNRDLEEKLLRIYRPYDIGHPLPWKMQTWNSDLPIFEELITEHRPARIIEVGTHLGGSAIQMAKICQRLQIDTKIICIDTWLGLDWFDESADLRVDWQSGVSNLYRQFASNVIHAGVRDLIVPFPQSSAVAVTLLAQMKIQADLIYIDGIHERDTVYSDCKNFWPLCTAAMFGDDYGWPTVKEAVDQFAGEQHSPIQPRSDSQHWLMYLSAVWGRLELARQKEARRIRFVNASQNAVGVPSLVSATARLPALTR